MDGANRTDFMTGGQQDPPIVHSQLKPDCPDSLVGQLNTALYFRCDTDRRLPAGVQCAESQYMCIAHARQWKDGAR